MRLTFVLPGRGGGGGAHSVVQEAAGLRRLGADTRIATTRDTLADFQATYPELASNEAQLAVFGDAAELAGVLQGTDLAIATTAPSTHLIAEAMALMEEAPPRTAYYIQDYEPLFFTPGTAEWQGARDSYTVLDRALLFAKTDWLCRLVEMNHGRTVAKVAPSLDSASFHPRLSARTREAVTVTAMVRPKTPRRAPRRTMRTLERIAATFPKQVRVFSFGCRPEELAAAGLTPSEKVVHLGVLSRVEVAELHRNTDLFLDLSDYQAFGRTGLEAMACGAVPVLPLFGGSTEYARHGENAYLVDTRSDAAVMQVVGDFVRGGPKGAEPMRRAAIETSLGYSIERAALSEFQAFAAHLG